MAKILENKPLADGFWLMRTEQPNAVKMGQFYMVRAWKTYPVLSRPISVYDADAQTITFVYRVVGKGTHIFSTLQPGEEITLQGPYGTGFTQPPQNTKRLAMVGGGVGIAPLYLAAKEIKAANPAIQIDLYLGFSGEPVLVEEFQAVADQVIVNVGGLITDEIAPQDYDLLFTCGPEVMMHALYQKCVAVHAQEKLYVSMENRMACGVGACLVCSCKTKNGNKKACKDGPVLTGEEVYGACVD